MSSGNTIVDSNKPLPLRLSVNEAAIDPINDNVSVPIIRLVYKITAQQSRAGGMESPRLAKEANAHD